MSGHEPSGDDTERKVEQNTTQTGGRTSLDVSRRQLLHGVAGAVAVDAFAGVSGAKPSAERHNIGVTPSKKALNNVRNQAKEIHRELDFGDIGRVVSGRFPKQAIQALEKRADVRFIEKDSQREAIAETLPWGVDRIDAEKVHADGRTGNGADIAILDTGIDSDHPDLQANLGQGKAIYNCSGSSCNEPWDDDHGHGTHVAGTADAVDNTEGVIGVSTEATLHAVKVLNENGVGYDSDIAAGLRWVADQNYDVGNMSLGGPSFSHTLADACLYAWDEGVLLVAASGNEGPCTDCIYYPAKLSSVIAVSAIDQSDSLGSFSRTGPEMELTAPGVDILSTIPGGDYASASGTSMASPHVAGTGGQLMALDYSNDNARDQLRQTAEDIGLSSNEQGFGLVDAEAAVPSPIGEIGTVSVSQSGSSDWHTVTYEKSFTDPTVIMKPVAFNGNDPCHARVRNVGSNSFEFKIEEWQNKDGVHTEETLGWLVVESGVHTLPDGTILVAGYVDGIDETFQTVSYGHTFENEPVVLTQPQTFNGSDPIVSRQRNIQTDRHEVRVQEEEGRDGYHIGERMGAVIMEPSTTSFYGTKFEMDRTGNSITDNWSKIEFNQEYKNPVFLSDMQTFDGPDTAGLRYRNLASTGVEIFVEEELSADSETNHTTEMVGYLALEGSDNVLQGDSNFILGTTTSGSEGYSYLGDVTTQ